MKKHSKELEAKLNGQQATGLDEALLDRLEAAVDGSLLELSAQDLKFEAQLRCIKLRALSSSLLSRLESAVDGLPAPSQVHVLPFPGANPEREISLAKAHNTRASWVAAAAAVVLLGVLSAIWIDPMAGPAQSAYNEKQPSANLAGSPAPMVGALPAEFTRALSETQDQGIIWPNNDSPHRVIKVTYTDTVSMTHEDGSTYEVEKPRVEYYLVPAESH